MRSRFFSLLRRLGIYYPMYSQADEPRNITFHREKVADAPIWGVYLERYILFHCRWFTVMLNGLRFSDPGPDYHDHPFWNFSLVLKGGYWEEHHDGRRKWLGPGSIYFRNAEKLHRVVLREQDHLGDEAIVGDAAPGSSKVWTLWLVGPARRRFGWSRAEWYPAKANKERPVRRYS